MKKSKFLIPVLTILLFYSCSDNSTPSAGLGSSLTVEEIKAEVIRASDQYTQAIAEVDTDKMLSFWAEDMIIFRPEGDDFVGKKSFSEFVRKFYADLEVKDVIIHERKLDVSKSLAVETIKYSESLKIDNGDWLPVEGRYLAVWRKEESGDWKLFKMVSLPGSEAEATKDQAEPE